MVAWIEKNAPKSYLSETLTTREVCSKAENGDGWARLAVEHVGYYLGLGVANLVSVFAPQTILLGGSVMEERALVPRPHLRGYPPELQVGSPRANGLIGAAQVWHHRFERGRVE